MSRGKERKGELDETRLVFGSTSDASYYLFGTHKTVFISLARSRLGSARNRGLSENFRGQHRSRRELNPTTSNRAHLLLAPNADNLSFPPPKLDGIIPSDCPPPSTNLPSTSSPANSRSFEPSSSHQTPPPRKRRHRGGCSKGAQMDVGGDSEDRRPGRDDAGDSSREKTGGDG